MASYIYRLKLALTGKKECTVSRQHTDTIEFDEDTIWFDEEKGGFDGTKVKKQMTAALRSLDFVKRIYHPCEIDAVLNLTGDVPDLDTLRNFFRGASADMELVDTGTTPVKSVTIASKYVVSDTVVVLHGSGTPDVRLKICSPDYCLECKEYSRAYTGRKFSSVICSAMTSLGMKDVALKTNLWFLGHDRPYGPKGTDKKKDELIQPYMVQYNETFYSFARRIANRCGEFLYYEGGSFHLGIADETLLDISSYSNLTYHKHERGTVTGVSGFHRDPVGGTMTTAGTWGSYNMVSVCEEYLDRIKKDGYDCQKEEYGARNSEMWSEFAASFCTSPSFIQAVVTFVIAHGKARLNAYRIAGVQNDRYAKSYFNNSGSFYTGKDNDEFFGHYNRIKGHKDTSVTEYAQFSTHPVQNVSDRKRDINNALLNLVREAQDSLWDTAVEVDLGAGLLPVSLGQRVTFNSRSAGKKYIVVEVSGGDAKSSGGKWKENMKIVAVPDTSATTGCPIPPSTGGDHVRRTGLQTAKVTTADLDPKRLGRVRVRFWWQGDGCGDESPWIRVSTLNARDGGGAYFMPEKGDECLLDFEDGNIERPYVVGYLNNSANGARYGTREYSDIISNGGGQTIRMKDVKDDTAIWAGAFPAMAFLRSFIPPISSPKGKFRKVSGFTEITDEYGLYDVKMSSADRKVTMKSPFGNIEITAYTGITLSAPNGDIKIQGKNVEITAGNNVSIISGANISDKKQIHSWKSLTDVLSGTLNAVLEKAIGSAIDLSLIRCIMESIAYPVSGNLSVKSNRFLLMEAGKGKATLPWNAYNNTLRVGWSYQTDEPYLLARIEHDLDPLVQNFKKLYEDKYRHAEHLMMAVSKYISKYDEYFDDNSEWKSSNLVKNSNGDEERYHAPDLNEFKGKFKEGIGDELMDGFGDIMLLDLFILANAINQDAYALKYKDSDIFCGNESSFAGPEQVRKAFELIKDECGLPCTDDTILGIAEGRGDADVPDAPTHGMVRKLIWAYLKQFGGQSKYGIGGDIGILLPSGPEFDDEGWKKTIEGIKTMKEAQDDFPLTLKTNLFKKLADVPGFVMGPERDRFSWSSESQGEIIMSQEADRVIRFGQQGFETRNGSTVNNIKAKCLDLGK